MKMQTISLVSCQLHKNGGSVDSEEGYQKYIAG